MADVGVLGAPSHTVRPVTVVCPGSSTTARRSGVKQVYEQRLAERFPCMRFVSAGVPGDTTERSRKRFDEDVLAHRPDLVAIQLGGIDAAVDVWKGKTTPRISEQRYEENLRYFVSTLRARGARVILMTAGMFRWTSKLREMYGKPPYDPTDPDGFNPMLRRYAEIVRRVARDEGVSLVDAFKAHGDYDRVGGQSVDRLFLDGMHPNDAGHVLVAELLETGCHQVPRSSLRRAFRAHIIVGGKVIVELKSVERVTRAHRKQVLTYLRLTGMRLGCLLNLGEGMMKRGITRTVNGLPYWDVPWRSWRLGERKSGFEPEDGRGCR